MVNRVTVIKTRVNKGSGYSSGGGKVKSVTDTTKFTYVMLESEKICWEKDKSKMNLRSLAEELGGIGCVEVKESDELLTLEDCCEVQ